LSFPSFDAPSTSPLISDDFILTFQAGEALNSTGLLVEITANYTVKRTGVASAASNSTKVVGLTLTKQATVGGKVAVLYRGVARAQAWGTINAGDNIASAGGGNATGTVMTDNSSKNKSIIGVCLQGASSGGTALVLLAP
jgi:hypothetical protein